MRLPHVLAPIIAVSLAIAAAPAAAQGPAPRGVLLIVGGGSQPPELVTHFVALAGGPGKAHIAVVPNASETPAETGKEKADELRGLGAEAWVLNLTREQAMSDSAARLLDGVTGVWFCGGDQARLTKLLLGTPVLAAIHRRYQAGAAIGGTSAGAAIMSDSMITGNHYEAGVDTAVYENSYPRVARHFMEITPGFGFLHGAIVDMHFLTRQRQNRLYSAVLERPTLVGVGIDEGTAIEVGPDGRWQVKGASSVFVMDARSSRVTSAGAKILGATGVNTFLLPPGSVYDPKTGTATLPAN